MVNKDGDCCPKSRTQRELEEGSCGPRGKRFSGPVLLLYPSIHLRRLVGGYKENQSLCRPGLWVVEKITQIFSIWEAEGISRRASDRDLLKRKRI